MTSRTLLLAALVVVSYVDASWLPWMSQLQTRDLEAGQPPNNDFNILHFNASSICLRLSTSISIQVQYKTTDGQDEILQLIVPHLTTENVEGSCGPDAFLHLSWLPETTTESSTEPVTDPSAAEEPTILRLEETSWFDPSATDNTNGNSLRFEFVQQNNTYFLANITGVINIVEAREDFPADSTTVELSVVDLVLFEAPLGVVSMCDETTILEAEFTGNVTAVNIMMTDVQLLAYWEESYWPYEAKSCRSSATKLDNTMSFVLGLVGALLMNFLQW